MRRKNQQFRLIYLFKNLTILLYPCRQAGEYRSFIVNASEQATNLELVSKIATVVNLFKSQFPDAKSDLKPWKNDPATRKLVDPDSIDIGFHFPGISKSWQSRSILTQIRFDQNPNNHDSRAIGIEISGYDHRGEVWRLSTVEKWLFCGESLPSPQIAEKVKQVCRQILAVFHSGAGENIA
jgi:hypothetical protein